MSIMGYFVNRRYNGEALFEDWLENVVSGYAPEVDRHIVVYTDNEELSRFVVPGLSIVVVKGNFSDIGENRLNKVKYLNEFCGTRYAKEADVLSFFQSNLRTTRHVLLDELLPVGFDLAVPYHPSFPSACGFSALYHNELVSPSGASVTDIAGKDTSACRYYQDGHFVGNREAFVSVVEAMSSMISEDRRIGVKIKGQPFDERYFNFYMNFMDGNNLKVNDLQPPVYNCWGSESPLCKIYQIDKRTSAMFSGGLGRRTAEERCQKRIISNDELKKRMGYYCYA